MFRGGDDQNLSYPRQHQCRQRIIDQGLIVYGEKLLAGCLRDWIEPRPMTAGKNDSLGHQKVSSATIASSSTQEQTASCHNGNRMPKSCAILLQSRQALAGR